MSATWRPGRMCGGCAKRPGTDASKEPETQADFDEAVRTGEPFFCHESMAVADPEGRMLDAKGARYRLLPRQQWRLCRAWQNARRNAPDLMEVEP